MAVRICLYAPRVKADWRGACFGSKFSWVRFSITRLIFYGSFVQRRGLLPSKQSMGVRFPHDLPFLGCVAERFIALVLKTREHVSVPWVQILPHPPFNGGEALMVKHAAFNRKNGDRYPAPLPFFPCPAPHIGVAYSLDIKRNRNPMRPRTIRHKLK